MNEFTYTVIDILYVLPHLEIKRGCNQEMWVNVDNKDNTPFIYVAVEFAKFVSIHYFTWLYEVERVVI